MSQLAVTEAFKSPKKHTRTDTNLEDSSPEDMSYIATDTEETSGGPDPDPRPGNGQPLQRQGALGANEFEYIQS